MNVGDYLRCSIESGAAIVPDIVTEIRRTRQNFLLDVKCDLEHDRIELYNHCYIVNSLKHPDEVNVLRRIYGDKFLLVSVVSSQRSRFDQLVAKIAKSHETTDESKFRDKADHLINKDRQRIDKKYGQNIGETYPLADVFIRGEQDLEGDLKRFLHILFGDQRETPTRLEYAMYEARANSLRSADLSRQVGAVITSQDFEIISRGCNEVPSAGGGHVLERRSRDNRGQPRYC